jgi:hypothetical protein
MQAEAVGHATPFRTLTRAPEASGAGCTIQLEPLHRSTRLAPIPERRTVEPTAVHEEASEQDTALSCAVGADGLRVEVTDHPEPEAFAPLGIAPIKITPASAATILLTSGPSSCVDIGL